MPCAGFASLPEVLPMAKPRVLARECKAAARRNLLPGAGWTSAALYFSIQSCSLSSKVKRLLELFTSSKVKVSSKGYTLPPRPKAIPSAEFLSEIFVSFGMWVEGAAQSR